MHILIGIDKHNNKNGVAKISSLLMEKQMPGMLFAYIRSSLINQFGLGIVTNYISIGWEDIGHGKTTLY